MIYNKWMPARLRSHAIILLLLSVLLFLFFDFSKHNPIVGSINPYAEDPFDAIGSFGVQAAGFLSVLAVFRAYRRYPGEHAMPDQIVYLVRTLVSGSLVVITVLAGDLVAMARFTALWADKPGGAALLALTAGAFLVTGLTSLYLWSTSIQFVPTGKRLPGVKATIVRIVFLLLLFIYPISARETIPGTLITVIVGAFLLFFTVWGWGSTLLPDDFLQQKTRVPRWSWLAVAGIGTLLGGGFVLRELWDQGKIALAGRGMVFGVFIGLETAGVLIGFAFLANYLGLAEFSWRKENDKDHGR